jgi:hypothetical protein
MGMGWKTRYHRRVSSYTTSLVTQAYLVREDRVHRAFNLSAGIFVGRPSETGKLERP